MYFFLCLVLFSACRISPFQRVSRKDFHTFCSVIESPVPSDIIDTIFQAVDKDHDGYLLFPEILRISDFIKEIFNPINKLRNRIRKKFLGEHICNTIENRFRMITYIKEYISQHSKLPPLNCIDFIYVYIFKYPHPYEYSYQPNCDGEELINKVIISYCLQYIGKAEEKKLKKINSKLRIDQIKNNIDQGERKNITKIQPIQEEKQLSENSSDEIPLTPTSLRALQTMANKPVSDRSIHPSNFDDDSTSGGSTFRYTSGNTYKSHLVIKVQGDSISGTTETDLSNLTSEKNRNNQNILRSTLNKTEFRSDKM